MFATAPFKVDVARDWWDYFVDGFTMLAAVVTLAAVIVALFGEDLRARRRRPKLKLTVETETEAIVVKGEGGRGVSSAYMQLYAEPGRDKAEDVEMFVSLGTTMESVEESPAVGVMRDVNLNFEGGRLGAGEGDTVTSVLPGMVRRRSADDVWRGQDALRRTAEGRGRLAARALR
jgi:hypothetical protein